MRRRSFGMTLTLAAPMALLAYALAGCGDDGDGKRSAQTPTPGNQPSRTATALPTGMVSPGSTVTATPIPVETPKLDSWTVAPDDVADAFLITPATALRGAGVYAVIATSGITDSEGQPLQATGEFKEQKGTNEPAGDGPRALYSGDAEAPGNPYPDARLVRPDGTVRVPDRFVLRGIPESPAAANARATLRAGAQRLETLRGYSTTAPMRIALSAPVDLGTVTPDTLFLFERTDGATDIEGLLAAAERLGVDREDVAIAFSFPTQPIENDLITVQALLRDRATTLSEPVNLVDPDPEDDLPIGVFGPDDAAFAEFFGDAPEVGTVVAGLVTSPDFRGADRTWAPARISGESPAPEVALDFLLTLPAAGTAPFPVVMVQHGFGGGNEIVLELGPELARHGLAAIGIDAVSHGRRGSPFDLLQATPFVARDIFRQTIADQMAVLRAIESGIDVDGDGVADLDASRMSYLGISLGGLVGATLVAVEEILPVAVLNVAGGRVAFLGRTEGLKDLVFGELAGQVELDVADPVFLTYLQRVLESGQHAMDVVDGLNFARRWFLDPFPGHTAHRVLLQEGIGDTLVDNVNTEALAAAGGLAANTPLSDPAGVSGLWRFEPPGGHGILARDDVRTQVFRFLTSNGTEIIDPTL